MKILKELKEIEANGFTVIKNVLDPDFVGSVTEKTYKQLTKLNKKWNVGKDSKFNCDFLGEDLIAIACNPTIVKVCKRMLGAEMRFDHAFGYKTVPNTTQTSLANSNVHGGVNSNLGMNFYRKGIPLENNFPRTFRLNVSLALTKCGPNHGGAQFLPKTHCNETSKKYGKNCVPEKINLNNMVIPESNI